MRPATFTCACALDGRVAEATGNQTDDDALTRLVRSTLDAARLRPIDPGWPALRHRPRRRRSITGTTRRPRPSRRNALSASAAFVARGGWPRDRRLLLDRGRRGRVRQLRRPARRRPLDDRSTRRDRADRELGRIGAGRVGAARRSRWSGRRRGGHAPGTRRRGRHRPRARRVRSRPVARVRRQRPRVSGASTASTAGPSTRAVPSPASASRSSTPPSRSPTTPRTRWRWASASMRRERRSAATSSCARCHERPRPRPPHRQGARRHVDRQRGGRRGPVRGAAGQPRRSSLARRRRMRSPVPSSAACSSPTSGTPASSTRARWSSPA